MKVIDIDFPRWMRTINGRFVGSLSHLKLLWTAWNLRGFILLSLALQTILVLFAPFRKRSANFFVIVSIWLAYLLADYIATQAVGLIPNYGQNEKLSRRRHNTTEEEQYVSLPHADLLAFWSPFLLVHLGGPDTITALSLEDNELWMRTGLHLCTQFSATGRVFFQSLPTSRLWLPTLLMFVAGILKYTERVLSLYHSRLSKFKSSMLKDMMKRVSEDFDGDKVTVGDNLDMDVLSNVEIVRKAYEYFDKYKGLYVDMIFSFRDRSESRDYFLYLNPKEAFQLIEIELNFTYEVFFTKMIVIHRRFGTVIRCISCSCQVLSLVIWSFFISNKSVFRPRDIQITYILLLGAIVLDIIAILRVLLSDWKVAMLDNNSEVRVLFYNLMMSFRDRTWGRYWGKELCPWVPYLRRLFFRRWSESVLQFNLITYCVVPWPEWVRFLFKILPLPENYDQMAYVSNKWFADDLRNFIFDEIKYKAEVAEDPADAEDVYNSTGDWVLRSLAGYEFDPFEFHPWTKVEYDKCLLMWHVATELLYHDSAEEPEPEESYRYYHKYSKTTHPDYCKYSKTLSDYMMYLLTQQQEMMLSVAGISEIRFRHTCAEAVKFFDRVLPKSKKRRTPNEACKMLMKVKTESDLRENKEHYWSESVLFDACRLAKKLKHLKSTTKVGMWKLIAKVWVELVSYSATHCRANSHAAQLKQGGELLTLVWLLMLHLGLGTQYRNTQQGNVRSYTSSLSTLY